MLDEEDGWWDIAQIYLNGHMVNAQVIGERSRSQALCDRCGKATIGAAAGNADRPDPYKRVHWHGPHWDCRTAPPGSPIPEARSCTRFGRRRRGLNTPRGDPAFGSKPRLCLAEYRVQRRRPSLDASG
jgi:hypothetical protein